MGSLPGETIKKIMIRSPNWIGDAVMTTPAMGAVRAFFPTAEIVLVANPPVAELFSPHPDCDRVIMYDKKEKHQRISGLLTFCQMLRREHFDLAILFQNAIEAAVISRLAKIPRRAGYATDGRRFLLSHPVPAGEKERLLHHTDYYLGMLAALGIAVPKGPLRLSVTSAEAQQAGKTLENGPWVAVNPGASYGAAKRWFPDRFAAVADQLIEKYQVKIVLTGGTGEQDIGRDIETSMTHTPLNLIGRTTVREMMAILERCCLLITNDSGPMHVAAALKTPLVAIFGPTDHTTTSPAAAAARIVRKDTPCAPCLLRQCPTDHQCMKAVTVDDVLRAAGKFIDGQR